MDDVSLAALAKMVNLRSLGLSRCKWLTDAAFSPLTSLTALEALNLGGTEVGSAALEVLGELPKLAHVNLSGCRWVGLKGAFMGREFAGFLFVPRVL